MSIRNRLKRFVSEQLRQPAGPFGSLVMGTMLDRTNTKIIAHTVDTLAIEPGESILDVGFGGGSALERMAEHVGEGVVVGVELSSPMVRRARRRLRRWIERGRIEVHEADVHRLPFEDGSFDRVCTINTIYFWPDPVAALREVHRVLRPGGRLVVALRSKATMEAMGTAPEVFTLFTPEEAHQVVEAAGFGSVRIDHRDRGERLDSVLVTAMA